MNPSSRPVPLAGAGRRGPFQQPVMLKPMPRTVPQGPPYQSVVGSFREAFSSRQKFRTEVLAGLATSFALIPEVISFAILAGVSPAVGLFSTVVLCFVIAFTGGRPAMITGAAGATALVIAPLVASHGTDYQIGRASCRERV